MKKTAKELMMNVSKINKTAMLIFKCTIIAVGLITAASIVCFYAISDKSIAHIIFDGACKTMVIGIIASTAIDILTKRE